ncbi:unknown [Bacteroides sp. CAG:1060]|nr:unknown [Bacteroides sp. CAG:1060]
MNYAIFCFIPISIDTINKLSGGPADTIVYLRSVTNAPFCYGKDLYIAFNTFCGIPF